LILIANLTQFGDSSSGIGALGIDAKALVIQVITFLLVIWVLQRWAFKPIVKIMERRRETIEKGVELGQQMQKDKEELEAKVAKALHEARTQADEIVSSARTQARQVVQEAEDDARVKAEAIVAEADSRIKQGTDRARRKLETELVGLVADATEAIIDEKIDARKDAGLIERALKGRA
jgi:F-type H+-transporting ATPase subunit b